MYGIPGNLLSSPVIHTGIPFFTCPITWAFFTRRALVPTSDEVIPPFAMMNFGFTESFPIILVTALEIFTDAQGGVIFKKYSPIGELSQFAGEYAESLAHTTGYLVLITDGDHVVAASGSGKRDFEGKPISGQLEEIIGERKSLVASDDEKTFVKLTADDAGEYRQQAISTIICEGDAIGAVILCSREEREKMGETESKLVAAAAGFLGRQMEQ